MGLFLFNRELIRRTVEETRFFDRLLNRPPAEAPAAQPGNVVAPQELPGAEKPAPAAEQPVPAVDLQPAAEDDTPVVVPAPPEKPAPLPPARDAKPAQKPAAAPVAAPKPTAAPAATPKPAAPKPAKPQPQAEDRAATRDRTLWFVRVDDDGIIARTKTVRSLSVSDAPLLDALSALIAGPTEAEKQKGLSSLIPAGTRLLSAIVRGDTAYLSFSEEFQFNSYGIEGYAAQLRQIIWTATEFSNVKTVQILIEGRRVDYLGSEGIWIGGPIGRESL